MKQDILRTTIGVALIALAAGIAFKVYRRTTEGSVSRMKAPFRGPLLPYPITSAVVSSKFGEIRNTGPHNGIDLKTRFNKDGEPDPNGTPDIGMVITSPIKGVVSQIFTNAGGGLQMLVKAEDGTILGLAHLLKTSVNVGDSVDVGDIIAGSGNSGPAGTPPHIHLTVHDVGGKLVDPAPYLGL